MLTEKDQKALLDTSRGTNHNTVGNGAALQKTCLAPQEFIAVRAFPHPPVHLSSSHPPALTPDSYSSSGYPSTKIMGNPLKFLD